MSGSEEEEEFNDEEAAANDDVVTQELANSLKKISKVVTNLMARADCEPFREPVDWKGLQLYDYPKIIPKIMDLGTIKKKLDKNKYHDVAEAADDIRLVWKNCMTYNMEGSDFYHLADSYSKRFEERYQKLIDEFGEDIITGNVAPGSTTNKSSGKKSRTNSFVGNSATGVGGGGSSKSPTAAFAEEASPPATTSKERGTVNYEALGIIPLDVRTRFAARLQRLSGMELGHVLKIIDMECPNALEDPTDDQLRMDAPPVTKRHRYSWDEFDGGCQIEVDVDAIPTETFHKLDEYVKEKVQDRGRGPWSDDLTESEQGGKKRKT